ncbi:hypothetical protein M5K25_019561 [Dendrobium thyrsiflorum]|uniref:Uncharacterized protein n=1 Tax=Dendrobium thyrsiflorum TaxID=117978 RepID=A0ABD0UM07_DENTH
MFGRPLQVNNATSVGSRPLLARILVELDITKKFPDKLWLGPEKFGCVQHVEMETFPSFCVPCKCIRHFSDDCRPQSSIPVNVATNTPKLVISNENATGANAILDNLNPISFDRNTDAMLNNLTVPLTPALVICGENCMKTTEAVDIGSGVIELGKNVDHDVEENVPSNNIFPLANAYVNRDGGDENLDVNNCGVNQCATPNLSSNADGVAVDSALDGDISTPCGVVHGPCFVGTLGPDIGPSNGINSLVLSPNVPNFVNRDVIDVPVSIISKDALNAHLNMKDSCLDQSDWLDGLAS